MQKKHEEKVIDPNDTINAGLQLILPKIFLAYQDGMDSFLISTLKENPSFRDADVAVLIMNIALKTMKHVFFSLHKFLPTTILDYEFLIITMLNNLKKELPEIIDIPRPFQITIDDEKIKLLKEEGEILVTASDGSEHLISEKDLLSSPVIIYQEIEKAKRQKKQKQKLKSDIIQLLN